jgi:hypothetical protein
MRFGFKYRGGVDNPTDQSNEKFLLFCIVGGREIPFYEMKSNALLQSTIQDPLASYMEEPDSHPGSTWYRTDSQFGKLFVSQQGFGVERKFFSFYFRFLPDDGTPKPVVTVRPFSFDQSGFFFKGCVSFLKKSEVRRILDPTSVSLKYLERQIMLPIPTLKKMVTIDRSGMRKGIRKINIGRKRKGA